MPLEVLVRLSAFSAVLGLTASWEMIAPRRRLTTSKLSRWVANQSVVINSIIVRPLYSAGAIATAMLAAGHHWGILNQVGWPIWIDIVLAVVALDLVLYL
jgi:sterol desaturase/sphingolipid hydroxylase (fatty acid hydroxylase superfamily)